MTRMTPPGRDIKFWNFNISILNTRAITSRVRNNFTAVIRGILAMRGITARIINVMDMNVSSSHISARHYALYARENGEMVTANVRSLFYQIPTPYLLHR